MHEGLSVLRDSYAFRQPGNTSQVFGDRMRWRADEKHQVHRWSISTERHSHLAPPNYQEKPGDRFSPRVRKGDLIRSCRGNCRLARADALDEQVGIPIAGCPRTTGAKAARHSSKVDALTFIRTPAGLTIFSSSTAVTGSQFTCSDGDQIVSYAAARKRAGRESSSLIRKILHRVARGAHASSRVIGRRPRRTTSREQVDNIAAEVLQKIRVTCINVNARVVPGEDAGHHTRDGCAPRTFGFDCRTIREAFSRDSAIKHCACETPRDVRHHDSLRQSPCPSKLSSPGLAHSIALDSDASSGLSVQLPGGSDAVANDHA
jgi:hypothetical protein